MTVLARRGTNAPDPCFILQNGRTVRILHFWDYLKSKRYSLSRAFGLCHTIDCTCYLEVTMFLLALVAWEISRALDASFILHFDGSLWFFQIESNHEGTLRFKIR